MFTLHQTNAVFSSRHVPSWLMLCLAAGAINGIALQACERFVTHVTGTVTWLGVEGGRFNLLLDFAAVITAFIAGAMTAGLLINGRVYRGKTPFYSLPMWMTSAITALVGFAGHSGWFGPFGGSVDEPLDFVLLCALGFAMGLQNAAVATSTGMLVRTTHLTGPATDLGTHLAEILTADPERRIFAKRHAALRGGKIVAYASGAASSVPLSHGFDFLALLFPAVVIGAATLLSFIPSARDVEQTGAN